MFKGIIFFLSFPVSLRSLSCSWHLLLFHVSIVIKVIVTICITVMDKGHYKWVVQTLSNNSNNNNNSFCCKE